MRTVRELSPFCLPNRLVGASLSHVSLSSPTFPFFALVHKPSADRLLVKPTSRSFRVFLQSSTTTGEVVQARRGWQGRGRGDLSKRRPRATDTDKDNSSDIYRGVRGGSWLFRARTNMLRSRSAPLTVEVTLLIASLFIVLFTTRLALVFRSPVWERTAEGPRAVQAERAQLVESLAQAVVGGRHILVTGSAGTGKTEAVKRALASIDKKEVCYINLLPLLSIPIDEDDASSFLKDAKDQLIQMVIQMDITLMQLLYDSGPVRWLSGFLPRYWLTLLTWRNFLEPTTYSTFPHSEYSTWGHSKFSVSAILNHVATSAERLSRLGGTPPVALPPVLVVDGLQALSSPRLAEINKEFVRFLGEVLPAKGDSRLQLVLISTESRRGANALLTSSLWGPGSSELLVQHEVVGDLTIAETREFLYTHSTSSDLAEPFVLNRLNVRVTNDTEFLRIYQRIGGYLPDVERFARAQLLAHDADVALSDHSRVALLEQQLEQQFEALGLDPSFLLVLFRAMLEKGKSPRAAVLLSEVVETLDVPESALVHLASLGLVELRERSPSALDYSALRSFGDDVHVCSVSPLSRFSMAKIVKRLEKLAPATATPGNQAGQGGGGSGKQSGGRGTRMATARNEL